MSIFRIRRSGWLFSIAIACSIATAARAQDDPNLCDQPGEEPNIVVGEIAEVDYWGAVGDTSAFSISTDSCNVGSCWANWISNTPAHPVIGQNMYRLKNGRYEHIGQAWLKHGFFALSEALCSDFCEETDGDHLGVNCSDLYTSGLNASQGGMGPKFEVNASTGVYPFPPTAWQQSGNAIYKRLQVKTADVDPALNAGAVYYVEGQYVAADDAQAGNGADSASLREITISGSPGNFNVNTIGTTYMSKAGIFGWKTKDAAVNFRKTSVPGDGDYWVGSKATSLGGGMWHYEFAVHNVNGDRAARAFSVPIPLGTNVSNLGFHDVPYHSGEPYSGTDWAGRVEPTQVIWETETFEENQWANALRWGTIYNFRFDADIAPTVQLVTLGLFKPGDPASRVVLADVPRICDNDEICDPGETCSNCLGDCGFQGGGPGCCGSGVCDPGETSCSCPADCGFPLDNQVEGNCGDGFDDDCDSLTDCSDPDCCSESECSGADGDNDSYEDCDCNNANAQVWSRPSAVDSLTLTKQAGTVLLSWAPPAAPGASAVTYETLRSINPANFVTSTTCLSTGLTVPFDDDAAIPGPGALYYYLVRAHNACPGALGDGDLGQNWHNQPRSGVNCP